MEAAGGQVKTMLLYVSPKCSGIPAADLPFISTVSIATNHVGRNGNPSKRPIKVMIVQRRVLLRGMKKMSATLCHMLWQATDLMKSVSFSCPWRGVSSEGCLSGRHLRLTPQQRCSFVKLPCLVNELLYSYEYVAFISPIP